MTKMSKILWEGHALSTDPNFPRAYEASILNPLHYKFLATPLITVGNLLRPVSLK